MRVTPRDIRLVRDVSLSHILSRDQAIRLGYFGSVSRANTRLKLLADAKYLKVFETPFHAQHLYQAGVKAGELLGGRIERIVSARTGSPRYIQHALAVTEIRLALSARGKDGWRFEVQARHSFEYGGGVLDVRPDGLFLSGSKALFIEADLGTCSLGKFGKKCAGYARYLESGSFAASYGDIAMQVLTVTTGIQRASSLNRVMGQHGLDFRVCTLEDLGITPPGAFS